jgi:hypothetical protein
MFISRWITLHLTQKHIFDEPINQSYLPAAIHGLQKVIDEYPLTS